MFRLPRRLAGWVVWRPTQFDVAATGNFRAVGCQPLVAHAKVNAQVCLNSEFGFRSKEFCRSYCKRSYWTEFVYQIYQTDSLKVARAFCLRREQEAATHQSTIEVDILSEGGKR